MNTNKRAFDPNTNDINSSPLENLNERLNNGFNKSERDISEKLFGFERCRFPAVIETR